jgi:hypothetical protein
MKGGGNIIFVFPSKCSYGREIAFFLIITVIQSDYIHFENFKKNMYEGNHFEE